MEELATVQSWVFIREQHIFYLNTEKIKIKKNPKDLKRTCLPFTSLTIYQQRVKAKMKHSLKSNLTQAQTQGSSEACIVTGFLEKSKERCREETAASPILYVLSAPGSVWELKQILRSATFSYKDRKQPWWGSWRRKEEGWQGCPVTWLNQGLGEDLEVIPAKGKPWQLANKFNPMTSISLRGENHITNIQKHYTTASCIMPPAQRTELWIVCSCPEARITANSLFSAEFSLESSFKLVCINE